MVSAVDALGAWAAAGENELRDAGAVALVRDLDELLDVLLGRR